METQEGRISTGRDGVIRIFPPVTAAEIQAVEKERKAKNILLMAIPKDNDKISKEWMMQKKSRKPTELGVPHPLSGDYTPKPQEEIDESLYVYGKKGPQEPEPSVSDDRSSEYSLSMNYHLLKNYENRRYRFIVEAIGTWQVTRDPLRILKNSIGDAVTILEVAQRPT
ncbi:hypothetical protein Tco_1404153 [Tanacetum coccineum]